MAKSQENGITILLRLKGYKVGKVSEGTEGIVVEVKANASGIRCPHCDSMRLYRHGLCQERTVGESERGFTSNFIVTAGYVRV